MPPTDRRTQPEGDAPATLALTELKPAACTLTAEVAPTIEPALVPLPLVAAARMIEATRAALDAPRPAPMQLGGADLHADLSQIHQSLVRMNPSSPSPLGRLRTKLGHVLRRTASTAKTLRTYHGLVREIAHVFKNRDGKPRWKVRRRYETVLNRWDRRYRRGGRRAAWIDAMIAAADAKDRDKLFTGYAHKNVPLDNNAQERDWGTVRRVERRAVGLDRAPNALVADDGRTASAILITLRFPPTATRAANAVPLVLPRARRSRSGATTRRSLRLSYRRDPTRFLAQAEALWTMR